MIATDAGSTSLPRTADAARPSLWRPAWVGPEIAPRIRGGSWTWAILPYDSTLVWKSIEKKLRRSPSGQDTKLPAEERDIAGGSWKARRVTANVTTAGQRLGDDHRRQDGRQGSQATSAARTRRCGRPRARSCRRSRPGAVQQRRIARDVPSTVAGQHVSA